MSGPQFWSEREMDELARLREICGSTTEIAEIMGRSESAIRKKLTIAGQSYGHAAEPWADDRAELLRRLWNDEGKSASQCAAILGITRSAVIGKAHRLGLAKRASPIIRRNNVVELNVGGCEWMHGEPRDHNYCGAPRQKGSSYCPEHHARCWVKPPPRNKDKPNPFAYIGDRALGKVRRAI